MSNIEFAPSALANRLHDDNAEELYILDIRRKEDYNEWQIPGSTNLPIYDDLLNYDYSSLKDHLDDLPQNKEIAIICVAGVTSARAAEFLREHGFDAKSVDNGMNGWGRVHQQYNVTGAEGVVQVVRPGTGCVSYIIHDDGEALIIDPTQYMDEYLRVADERDLEIIGVTDTHAHADHISGARKLSGELDVPYYLHENDVSELDNITELEDGETLTVGTREIDVIHTPGHTHGSVSFQFGDALLSGDTLFLRSVGRPDLEDNSEDAVRQAASLLFDSLTDLTDRPDETIVLPGHFSNEMSRPLATELGEVREESNNELLSYVTDGDEKKFVETIVESLSDEPANYNEIKEINWGKKQLGANAESLELGPNNCAAN